MAITSTSRSLITKHFIGEKLQSICFLEQSRYETSHANGTTLPIVATGSWDCSINHIALHLPSIISSDEEMLEFELVSQETINTNRKRLKPCDFKQIAEIKHEGDVNALRFTTMPNGDQLLFAASSSGHVNCYRIVIHDNRDMTIPTSATFQRQTLRHWENLFVNDASITSMDMSNSKTALVAGSEDGDLVWLKLDSSMGVEKLEPISTRSKLPLHKLKFLAKDSVIASAGSVPGRQLKIWDISQSTQHPISEASLPNHNAVAFTALDTHPTRPELLFVGTQNGTVAIFDMRKLKSPIFMNNQYHMHAVHDLLLNQKSPNLLYTASDDSTLLSWNFQHQKSSRESIEYDSRLGHDRHHLHVQEIVSEIFPINSMDFHTESDTLIAASNSQTITMIQNASVSHLSATHSN